MKLIVGLGNPGRKYEQTRHNVGFVAAAKLASLIGAGPAKIRFEGELVEGVASDKLVVLCPHTFMNASGKSVRKAYDFYKLTPEQILVICDDLDLPTGRIRIRASGSAGGQKGLADIIRHLGTDQVPRLKIGIDRPPPDWNTSGYVLGKFTEEEKNTIEQSTGEAAKAALDWARHGVQYAANRYNAKPEKKQSRGGAPASRDPNAAPRRNTPSIDSGSEPTARPNDR